MLLKSIEMFQANGAIVLEAVSALRLLGQLMECREEIIQQGGIATLLSVATVHLENPHIVREASGFLKLALDGQGIYSGGNVKYFPLVVDALWLHTDNSRIMNNVCLLVSQCRSGDVLSSLPMQKWDILEKLVAKYPNNSAICESISEILTNISLAGTVLLFAYSSPTHPPTHPHTHTQHTDGMCENYFSTSGAQWTLLMCMKYCASSGPIQAACTLALCNIVKKKRVIESLDHAAVYDVLFAAMSVFQNNTTIFDCGCTVFVAVLTAKHSTLSVPRPCLDFFIEVLPSSQYEPSLKHGIELIHLIICKSKFRFLFAVLVRTLFLVCFLSTNFCVCVSLLPVHRPAPQRANHCQGRGRPSRSLWEGSEESRGGRDACTCRGDCCRSCASG